MATSSPTTATEILGEVIGPMEPSFAPEFARMVLGLHLGDSSQDRIRDLLLRNNAGALDSAEHAVLENYLLVGQFLDVLQAKARVKLHDGGVP